MVSIMDQQLDGYVRVSRVAGREGDSYISPDVQREAIAKWAEYRGVKIAQWHLDEDWSGGTHDRPGLKSAIDRALNGETGGIVAWKLDRFSRNTEAALHDLHRLKDANARLAFVVEDIDTGTVYGKMVYTILLAVSEAFLENVKSNWSIAKQRAIERGAFIAATPFGYRRLENGQLEPDPKTAPVVEKAFQLAADQGISAALEYLRQFKSYWKPYHVRRLLSNRIYIGEQRYGDLLKTDAHEPLVSRDVFERAQVDYVPLARKSASYPLSGLATCANCGNFLVGGNHRTYTCRASLTDWTGEHCDHPASIKAKALEDHLVQMIVNAYSEDGRNTLLVSRDDESADLSKLQSELRAAEAERDRFAADPTAAELLGELAWANALRTRSERVRTAQEAYREAANATRQVGISLPAEALKTLSGEDLATIFRAVFADVIIKRRGGGLSVEDRVAVMPHSNAQAIAA